MDVRVAAFVLIAAYLLLFMIMSRSAARAAGRNVWLFSSATGTDRLAAYGFRISFIIALVWPVALLALPGLASLDFLTAAGSPLLASAGLFVAAVGGMIAFASQVSMGASWRVGVKNGDLGALVSGGLYEYSRNPTFVGQALLLVGTTAVAPSLGALLAAILFLWSAYSQVRSEEIALQQTHGSAYTLYCRRVPRWLGMPAQAGK